jgi:hypothetical protein
VQLESLPELPVHVSAAAAAAAVVVIIISCVCVYVVVSDITNNYLTDPQTASSPTN